MVNVSLKVDVYHKEKCIDLRLNPRFHLKLRAMAWVNRPPHSHTYIPTHTDSHTHEHTKTNEHKRTQNIVYRLNARKGTELITVVSLELITFQSPGQFHAE
jgi:hypothetical protein